MKVSYAISNGEGTLIDYGSIDWFDTDFDAMVYDAETHGGTLIIGPYDGTGE